MAMVVILEMRIVRLVRNSNERENNNDNKVVASFVLREKVVRYFKFYDTDSCE